MSFSVTSYLIYDIKSILLERIDLKQYVVSIHEEFVTLYYKFIYFRINSHYKRSYVNLEIYINFLTYNIFYFFLYV